MDRPSSRATTQKTNTKTKKNSRPPGTIETNQSQQAPLPASGAEPRPSTSSLQQQQQQPRPPPPPPSTPSTPKPPRAGPMRGPMAPNANAIMQPPKMTTTSSATSINHNSIDAVGGGQRAALKLGPRPAPVVVVATATANKQPPPQVPQKVAWQPARGGICFPAPDSPSVSLGGHCPAPLMECSLATTTTTTTTTSATNTNSGPDRAHLIEAGGLNSDDLSECSCNSLDCLTTDMSQSPTSSQLDQPLMADCGPTTDVMMQQLPGHLHQSPARHHQHQHQHQHHQHHNHHHYLPAPLQVHHMHPQQQQHHQHHSHPHHHHHHHHHHGKPHHQLHHQQMHGDSQAPYHQQTMSNQSNNDSLSLSLQHRPVIGPALTHPGAASAGRGSPPHRHPQPLQQPPPLVRHSTYTAGTDTITDRQHHPHHHQQQPHGGYHKSLSPPPPPAPPPSVTGAPNSDFIPTNQQVYAARNNNNNHQQHLHNQPDPNSAMMGTQKQQHYRSQLRPVVSFRRAATIREPVNHRWRTQLHLQQQQQHQDQQLLFDYNNNNNSNQEQHQLIEQTPLERSYRNGTNSLQRQRSAASVGGAYGSQQSSSSATPRLGPNDQNPNPNNRPSMRMNTNLNGSCPPPPSSPFMAPNGTRISTTPHNGLTNSNPPTSVYYPGSPIPPPQSQSQSTQIQPQPPPPPAPPPPLPPLASTASFHSNHRTPHHMSMAASPFDGAPFCPLPAITSHRTNSPWMRISSIIATPIGIVIILFIVISPLLHYLM